MVSSTIDRAAARRARARSSAVSICRCAARRRRTGPRTARAPPSARAPAGRRGRPRLVQQPGAPGRGASGSTCTTGARRRCRPRTPAAPPPPCRRRRGGARRGRRRRSSRRRRSLEAELAAEEVGQDLRRARDGQPVEVVVGVHDRGEPGLVDGGAERARRRRRATVAARSTTSPWFRPPSGAPWPMKCLPQQCTPWRLHAPHEGDAHAAGQLGILAVGLLERGPSAGHGRCRAPARGRGGRRRPRTCRPMTAATCSDERRDPRSRPGRSPAGTWSPRGPSGPDRASSWASAGMPRRVRSSRNRWIRSLASAAGAGIEARCAAIRAMWPMPWDRARSIGSSSSRTVHEQLRCTRRHPAGRTSPRGSSPEQLLDVHV